MKGELEHVIRGTTGELENVTGELENMTAGLEYMSRKLEFTIRGLEHMTVAVEYCRSEEELHAQNSCALLIICILLFPHKHI